MGLTKAGHDSGVVIILSGCISGTSLYVAVRIACNEHQSMSFYGRIKKYTAAPL